MSNKNYIKLAKKSAAKQISELKKINKVFNSSFVKAVESIYKCRGKVICAGIGKSGLIARKVSATLSSVGISSFFLSPSEANHGDLGQIDKKDLLLVFSYSGNTTELTSILKYANRFNIKIIGVASKPDSTLIKASDIKILIPNVNEADPTGMVPTSSTSITLLLGDCLAVALMNKIKHKQFSFHMYMTVKKRKHFVASVKKRKRIEILISFKFIFQFFFGSDKFSFLFFFYNFLN